MDLSLPDIGPAIGLRAAGGEHHDARQAYRQTSPSLTSALFLSSWVGWNQFTRISPRIEG
jgi:hypothetical protein